MGKQQVHTRLSTEMVKNILDRYEEASLDLLAAMAMLGVKKINILVLINDTLLQFLILLFFPQKLSS